MTRVSPYTRLRDGAREIIAKLANPHTRHMITVNPETNSLWLAIRERTIAAKALRYEVVVSTDENGRVVFEYRKTVSEYEIPWELRT